MLPGQSVGEGGFEPPTSCSQSRCATTAPLPMDSPSVVGTPSTARRNRMPGGHRAADRLARLMRSTVEPLEGNKVKVSVAVEAEEFERAVDAAFKKIAKEVRLPGFRPGKAPRKVLEARFGSQAGRV